MHNQPIGQANLQREKALFRYSSALERGDFEVVAAVLQQAESDPALEQMIVEMNAVYSAEMNAVVEDDVARIVQQLIVHHIPSGAAAAEDTVELPPLTIGDVVARLQTDFSVGGQSHLEFDEVARQLRTSEVVLPESLSQRRIGQLFEQIGVEVSRRFQKLFRDTAIFLSMGREQGMTRLAATRHQRRLDEQHLSPLDAGAEEEEHDSPTATN